MISYAIITKGDRPEKLKALIDSIRTVPHECEITVAVETGAQCLGLLRNQACRKSKFDILAVCDDDLIFDADFIPGLLGFLEPWDIMCPKVLNPDGSRYWDWREWYGDSQAMVDYSVPDTGRIIPPGCFVLLKRDVFQRVQWDEDIPFYTPPFEDVDFGQCLHAAGYKCTMNPFMTVHHNDPRYYQVENTVGKR